MPETSRKRKRKKERREKKKEKEKKKRKGKKRGKKQPQEQYIFSSSRDGLEMSPEEREVWTRCPLRIPNLKSSYQRPPNPRLHGLGLHVSLQEVGAKLAQAEAQGQSPGSNPRGHLAHPSCSCSPFARPPGEHPRPGQQAGPTSLSDKAGLVS